jgi:hypothetical protein
MYYAGTKVDNVRTSQQENYLINITHSLTAHVMLLFSLQSFEFAPSKMMVLLVLKGIVQRILTGVDNMLK